MHDFGHVNSEEVNGSILRNPKETRWEKTQESADVTVNIRIQSHLFCATVSRCTKFTEFHFVFGHL